MCNSIQYSIFGTNYELRFTNCKVHSRHWDRKKKKSEIECTRVVHIINDIKVTVFFFVCFSNEYLYQFTLVDRPKKRAKKKNYLNTKKKRYWILKSFFCCLPSSFCFILNAVSVISCALNRLAQYIESYKIINKISNKQQRRSKNIFLFSHTNQAVCVRETKL